MSDTPPTTEPHPPETPPGPVDPASKLSTRLNLIFEVGRASLSKLDMGELLDTAAQAIYRHFGYFDVSIFLVDGEAQDCVLVAHAGSFKSPDIRGYRQKSSVGIVGWVATHGQAVLANDVRQDPRYVVAFEGEESLLSELVVPIRLHGRTLGVINVEKQEVNSFDETDQIALETLSDQIAQAIANAQLFEQTRLLLDLNRSIINAIPSGVCVLDAHRRVLFASPVFCGLIGATPEAVKGRLAEEALPEPLLQGTPLRQSIDEALSGRSAEPKLFTDVPLPAPPPGRLLNIHVTQAHMPDGVGVLIMLEDVTEWRRATALAEERRALLDLIVSRVPVAVVSFDPEGRFTFWGNGAERLFARSSEDTLGKVTLYDLVSDRAALGALLERCRNEGKAEGELTARRPDGATVPVLCVLGRLADPSGRHTGYSAMVADITERRRAAEDLLREKQKLEHVVGFVGAGLALIDRDHRITWANRTIKEWFGRGEPVEGRLCHEIYCRRNTRCTNCPASACIASGENSEQEASVIRSDGVLRQYHHAVTPVLGPDGRVDHVLKLTLDVTDQSKKVYQLSRMRQLTELMQGVLDVDLLLHFVLTCVTAGHALGFNRAILLLKDRDRNILEGRIGVGPGSAEEAGRIWSQISRESATLEDLLSRGDHEAHQASRMTEIARTIRIPMSDTSHIAVQCAVGRAPIVVEDAWRDPRVSDDFRRVLGSQRFVLAPLIARNEPIGVIMADNLYSGQPITQEHVELLSMFAAQAALALENAENYNRLQVEKQHLEQAYRDLADAQDRLVRGERLVAIGRMSTHVAHEIRNPLVTIGGFANSLLQHPEADREQVLRYAQIISNEVRRLENILARVMDFTRPPKPMLKDHLLFPIIRQTLEQLQDRAQRQNVALRVELTAPGPGLQLDCDQMKQVFLNLFQNALDVMREGGRLSVTAVTDAHQVAITVGNTGEPIRPGDVPHLFEPFFTTKPGGTGLGLAVSQKIVQDHGGDIRLLSSLERGTEFIVALPLARRATMPASLE